MGRPALTAEEKAARVKARRAAYYQRKKEEIKAKVRQAYAARPDVVKARTASYREANSKTVAERKRLAYLKVQDRNYKKLYGMGVDDIEVMLREQGGACGVCGSGINMSTKRVDHCHATGYVRGLLCWNCNTGIGKLGDSIGGLKRALAYLEKEPTSFKAQ